MTLEQRSWVQRRADALAALPGAPDRPLERPSRAQDSALSDDDPQSHQWVVATVIPVTNREAKRADFRGTFRVDAGLKVEAQDVFCSACRRPYGNAADSVCPASFAAKSGRGDHLVGGNPHERARRVVSAKSYRQLLRARANRSRVRAAQSQALERNGDGGSAA